MDRLQQARTVLLALGLPLLNGLSSEHGHLLATLARGDWALAGVDLGLLAAGVISALCARHFAQPQQAVVPRGRRHLLEEAV